LRTTSTVAGEQQRAANAKRDDPNLVDSNVSARPCAARALLEGGAVSGW
jgi:hypothetical protein